MNRKTSFLPVLLTLLSITAILPGSVSIAQTVSSETSTTTNIFSDVNSSARYADAIQYLKNQNIIEGYSDGTYKPDQQINRAEFLKILIGSKYQNLTGSNCFPDVKNEWFAPYICKAKSLNVIEGYPDGTFKPSQNITFAEAAKIITKTYLLDTGIQQSSDQWYKVYVDALSSVNDIPLSIEYFDQPITRDEMAEMIWRIKASISKASRNYDELNGDQPYTVKTCSELEARYLDVANRYQIGIEKGQPVRATDQNMTTIQTAPTAAPSTTTSAPNSGAAPGLSSPDYSNTNLQVAGVDEGDIVKNDGKYIYVIKGNTIHIIDAYPASSMKDLVKFDFTNKDSNFTPSDLYLDGNTLVVIGSSYNYQIYPLVDQGISSTSVLYPRNSSRVKAFVLDVSDHTSPKVVRSVEFEGNLNTSRRINDTLYMVMNYPQYYPIPYYGIYQPQSSNFGLYLPQMQDSVKGTDEQILPCDQIHILPKPHNFNYLITAAIPLKDLTKDIARSVVIGDTENVYSSDQNLYVASTDYSGPYFAYRNDPTTTIYRFALSDGEINFNGVGSVPGTVLNQFSMDESGNYFRLATSNNDFNSQDYSSSIYVLDSNLKIQGKLTGIGKGENLYSARFVDNRAYLVSYQYIDPLSVIDLQDPSNPRLLGELKIPGFSRYLEPYDQNHILGFGQDTDTTANSGSLNWSSIKGLKIGLFDVTDPSKPKQMYQEIIGEQGSTSDVLYNHKALLFDKSKNLLALPVTVTALPQDPAQCSTYTYSTCPTSCNKVCVPSSCTVQNGVTVCSTDCDGANSCQANYQYQYPKTVFMGAYVYEVTLSGGFKLKAKITHLNDQEQSDLLTNGWGNYEKAIQRILYIGNSLYTVSQDIVQANDLTTYSLQNAIDMGPTNYGSPTPIPIDAPVSGTSGSGIATPTTAPAIQ